MLPVLSYNFAGIGTRALTNDGLDGIVQIYKNTFDKKYKSPNINIVEADIEDSKLDHNQFDVIYAHNILQYCINPLQTIGHWWDLARDNGMLSIAVPESTLIERNQVSLRSCCRPIQS